MNHVTVIYLNIRGLSVVTHLHEARLIGRQAAGSALEHLLAPLVDHHLDSHEAVSAGLRDARAVLCAIGACHSRALAYCASAYNKQNIHKSDICHIIL